MGGHAKPSCERQLSVQLVVFSTAAAFATCARLGPRCDSAARSVQSVRSDKGGLSREIGSLRLGHTRLTVFQAPSLCKVGDRMRPPPITAKLSVCIVYRDANYERNRLP